MLKIGQLANKSGVSVETIRYYEKEGLLEAKLRADNGYRYFNQQAVTKLAFIRQAKELGFNLATIKELLTLNAERDLHTCEEIKAIAGEKLAQVEEKIRQLQHLKQALSDVYKSCEGGDAPATQCAILQALDQSTNP
jgi:MerR family Zn(II)-responsive transcriptional regulator of zntA